MAIEIVSFPMKHSDFPVRYVSHCQRVDEFCCLAPLPGDLAVRSAAAACGMGLCRSLKGREYLRSFVQAGDVVCPLVNPSYKLVYNPI